MKNLIGNGRRLFSSKGNTNPTLSPNQVPDLVTKFVQLQFVRSQGPGGQKVNKTSSCVVAKIDLHDANLTQFLPKEAKERLLNSQNETDSWRNRVNKKGELIVRSEEERYQHVNRGIALKKLVGIVQDSLIEPFHWDGWVEVTEKGKRQRRDMKMKKSLKKESRKKP